MKVKKNREKWEKNEKNEKKMWDVTPRIVKLHYVMITNFLQHMGVIEIPFFFF